MGDIDVDALEQRLGIALKPTDSRMPDTEALMRRARRQVALKDVASFGIAHLLRTLLTLCTGLYRQAEHARIVMQHNTKTDQSSITVGTA